MTLIDVQVADRVATVIPTLGMTVAEGIHALHDGWELSRPDAAQVLGATAAEMRDAGCSPKEIMAARPRDVLRSLPDDPVLAVRTNDYRRQLLGLLSVDRPGAG